MAFSCRPLRRPPDRPACGTRYGRPIGSPHWTVPSSCIRERIADGLRRPGRPTLPTGSNRVGMLSVTLEPSSARRPTALSPRLAALVAATLIFISIRFLAFRFIDYAVELRTVEILKSQSQLMGMMRQREEAENRFHRASEAGRVGWWEWNLTSDEMHVSPILRELLGPDGK